MVKLTSTKKIKIDRQRTNFYEIILGKTKRKQNKIQKISKTCYQNLKYDKKQLNSIQKLSQATLSKYFLVFQYLSKNVSSDCQLF